MVARRLNGHGEIVMRLTKVGQPDSPSGSGGELGCLTLKGFRLRAEPPRVRTMERQRGLDGASNEALAHALAVWAELKGGRTSWSEGHAAEATWSLFLPLFGSDHVPPAASDRTEPNRATEGSGQQILVADDDSMVRALVSAALRREGMLVVEAGDGEEAVSRLMEEPGAFGLVLLDLHMPRLGGQDALERLRAVKPALKAIFLTGSVAVDPPETRADADVVRLQKPFVIADLLSAVRESLNA
jgi:CheY-like chemotaxis protein